MNHLLKLKVATLVAASIGFFLFGHAAWSQGYPTKAVHIVVPFAAGGGSDILARTVAQKLSGALGQSVVVENKSGAGGNLGTDFVAKAAPDGYTIVMGVSGPIAVNPSLFGNLPFDPIRDFAPITQAVAVTNMLVVRSDMPVNNLRELIEYGKQNPGKLSAGTGGVGTTGHMASELFKSSAKIDMIVVPYRGAAPAVVDVLGGQVSMVFEGIASTLPYVRSGKLKAIAVTTSARSSLMPDVPTMAESGLPGYEASNWYGFLAPAQTPKPIVERLHKEIAKILSEPETKEKLATLGAEVIANTPEEFSQNIKADIETWRQVVAKTGAKSE
ncbi:tripartite tricarboxylate transporter substrate binding protein [Alcaligenaceae bacterium]|nr:tripartite tricarboxylate transporter substrate binding protein [Alcaligenaceae bacterium]